MSTASEAVLAPSASWGVLLKETILDLCVDRVQPLLGAFGFLAVRVLVCLELCNTVLGCTQLLCEV